MFLFPRKENKMQLPDWVEKEWNEITISYTWERNEQGAAPPFTFQKCDINRRLQFMFCYKTDLSKTILKNYGSMLLNERELQKASIKIIELKFQTEITKSSVCNCLKDIAQRTEEVSLNLSSPLGKKFNNNANVAKPSIIQDRKAMVLQGAPKQNYIHCVASDEETLNTLLGGIGFDQKDIISIKEDDINKRLKTENETNISIKAHTELETKYTLEVSLFSRCF